MTMGKICGGSIHHFVITHFATMKHFFSIASERGRESNRGTVIFFLFFAIPTRAISPVGFFMEVSLTGWANVSTVHSGNAHLKRAQFCRLDLGRFSSTALALRASSDWSSRSRIKMLKMLKIMWELSRRCGGWHKMPRSEQSWLHFLNKGKIQLPHLRLWIWQSEMDLRITFRG